jgi:Ser/Thr protein kinase RdoA (MazF antagonist)
MQAEFLDPIARGILRHYPSALYPTSCKALGNHGGFSGARLWRIESAAGPLCLRAWPPGDPSAQRLGFLHRLLISAREAGLSFVPALFRTGDQSTCVDHAGRLWELTQWMPGRADFHGCPRPARLEAACRGLAHLHDCWHRLADPPNDVCPAITRRLEKAHQARALLQSGWRPTFPPGDPARPHVEKVWPLLPVCLDAMIPALERWSVRRWSLQPCLCDVWHDHVLFKDDRLSGLIDYGSAKIDHVAVDLARMLGSLVGDNASAWERGLSAYRTVRPFSTEEEELAHLLDETGTVLGMVTWLRWLYRGERQIEDREKAAERMRELADRMISASEKRTGAVGRSG